MFQPDFPAPLAATRASAPTAPVMPAGGGGLFGAVHAEVSRFIAEGSSSTEWTQGQALSVEGQVQRARLQADADAAVDARSDGAQQAFLESIAPYARDAGQRLGVAPELVAAHAALESGWGRHPLRQADGAPTNNLFGLKAQGGWRGAVAHAATTEYEGGAALKKTEAFRSYPDQAGAFRDYAQLLLENPRYRSALNTGSDAQAFAQGLARGGYATDPAYAAKLARVAQRIQSGD